MDEQRELALAATFEQHRPHLRAMATRLLGSAHEADDAVQETWLRLVRTDTADVVNLGGWLTTVVSRVCLDSLRARGRRREDVVGEHVELPDDGPGPDAEAELADQVGAALLVVLDTLTPAERLAFVLHDLFGMPFEEIAGVVGRAPTAVRQLASRGRRRVQQPGSDTGPDRATQQRVVQAFLAAARGGDLQGLLDLLDPGAVVRADGAASAMGSPDLTGRAAVAAFFDGSARAARLMTVDGWAGAVWQHRGEVKVVFAFTVEDGLVTAIELLADPETLASTTIGRPPTP